MFNDDIYPPAKDYMSQPLYVRQPCSLQIIQLVECSPPPPPQQQHQRQKYSPSRLSSSSSSYSDSDTDTDDDDDDGSAYDSSESSLDAGGGSSYCSSAEEDSSAVPPVLPPALDNRDPSVDDTYHTRQRRVSLWRDAVSPVSNTATTSTTTTATTTSAPRPASPSQKRKTPDGDLANSDSVTSHTPPRKSTRSTPSAHSCPACDEDFSSPLSLRQHASASRNANEACRIAVEYGFE